MTQEIIGAKITNGSEKVDSFSEKNFLVCKERLEKKCLTLFYRYYKIFGHTFGEVSEWFKELVLKTSDSARGRGFESHLLRCIHWDTN